ncbi:TonB-dependent receptor plug domain-containing protein [Planctomycetota bacterium]
MKKTISICAVPAFIFTFFPLLALAQTEEEAESYLFEELPAIVTASKVEQSVTLAPSVVTVITRKDIEEQGFKSMDEVLRRVAGFFPTRNREWGVINNRGSAAQTNKHYLFLIDGHNNNSMIFTGFHSQHEYPLLDKVERIEVIRGPGSTLWGSDAVLGIINIITRDGSKMDGLEMTLDYHKYDAESKLPRSTVSHRTEYGGQAGYRNGDNYRVNLMYGKEFSEDTKAMASFTLFDGQGYELDIEAPATSEPGSYGATQPIKDWDNSYELYAKAQTGEYKVKARALWGSAVDFWKSSLNGSYYRNGSTGHVKEIWKQFWVEAARERELADNLVWENKLFADSIFQDKYVIDLQVDHKDRLYEEQGFGLESTIYYSTDHHNLKTGFRFVRTNIGPMIGAGLTYDPNEDGNFITSGNAYYRAPGGTDNTLGVYAEDQWLVLESVSLVYGARIETNDLRDSKTAVLPRLGLIHQATDKLTVKYLYNTGYRRPSYWEAFKNAYAMPTKAEDVEQLDIQIQYNTDNLQLSVVPYFTRMKNYVDWITHPSDANQSGNGNMGTMESRGIELDFKQNVFDKVVIYGNVAYVDSAEIELKSTVSKAEMVSTDGSTVGSPEWIYNLGATYAPVRGFTANVHMRGWKNMIEYNTLKYSSNYGTLSGDYYFDFNLRYEFEKVPLSLSLYALNILNEGGGIADNYRGGTIAPEPLSIGITANYKF